MSSIQKTAKGYRAQVSVKGERASETLPTKKEAQQWAAKRESEMRAGQSGVTSVKTLSDAFRKYSEEVSPKRRGWRWEHLRLAAFERSKMLPCKVKLSAITPEHIAAWRDSRLNDVAPGTVLRELTLLSAVFEVARREWRWLEANPVKIIRKPAKPAHRERLISWHEIKAMLRSLNHQPGAPAKSITQSIALCFMAALRTGMRAGELATLKWAHHHDNYVHLGKTKSGGARAVPLSTKARRIFSQAKGFDPELCFGVNGSTLDTLFRRARVRAGLSGFTFHDARHVAATWVGRSGKLELLEMCKMFGWKDPKHALIYFNPTVGDLASKLG